MTEKKSIIHLCAFLLNFGVCCVKISDGLKTGGLPAMRKVGVVGITQFKTLKKSLQSKI